MYLTKQQRNEINKIISNRFTESLPEDFPLLNEKIVTSEPVIGGGESQSGGSVDRRILKTTQIVNNSATFQTIPDLTFSVLTYTNYLVKFCYMVSASGGADMKFNFVIPSNATFLYQDFTQSGINAYDQDDAFTENTFGITTTQIVRGEGILQIDDTAGSFVCQFAQKSAHPSDSKLYEGSWIMFAEEQA